MNRVGLHGVALYMTGYKHLTTSNVPVTTLEDMQGVKFRAMASPILLAQFKALANALSIPFAEVYNALQSGVAEGQENLYWAIHKMRFFEVQKYLSVSRHGLIVVAVLMSKSWWDKLPAELQTLVTKVFNEAEKVTWEVAERIDQEAVKAMQAAGLQFVTISPEERERFRQATVDVKQVYIQRVGTTGKRLLEMIEADIAEVAK
ncbi:TRAP transporter substrate-binding protein [Candidatus Entotheonella palauensis]|uniref:TRAP transporter substrate-binding protein n=1 Tax=Candidatus Entotheonella palauensis TaxID=93172 RepID=UPI000B7CB1A7|nr:TRAP transporter substrate-binding protein DctP [Candidatus Entotheonella palauensis]